MRRITTTLLTMISVSIVSASAALACACCGTYQVSGVAQSDVLNMRAGPGVGFSKVGSIPAGSGCVIKSRRCERRWCRVSFAGTKGWVNTRYLRYLK